MTRSRPGKSIFSAIGIYNNNEKKQQQYRMQYISSLFICLRFVFIIVLEETREKYIFVVQKYIGTGSFSERVPSKSRKMSFRSYKTGNSYHFLCLSLYFFYIPWGT